MKILFDLFPVILFFIMFRWSEGHAVTAQTFLQNNFGALISGGMISEQQAPIMLATLVTVAASLLQIGYLLVRRKKVDGMLWISFLIVCVFGGLTIYFHNETFIKWKPTMLYWSYAAALLISQLFFNKNLTKTFLSKLEDEFVIPDTLWKPLNGVWIVFFSAMGGLNLFVAYNFPTPVWVNFKFFGSTGLMFAFMMGQILFLSKYSKSANK